MVKKFFVLFLCLVILIVGLFICLYLNPRVNIIEVSEVGKMIISNFVGDISYTTTDRILIENISDQINNLSYSRRKFDYQSLPDIAIITYSENGDIICIFYLYKINDNKYFCRYEKNGKRSGRFWVDAENLFNLAKGYLPPETLQSSDD